LVETATLLPRKNPNYNPDLIYGGFQMVKGGYLAGGNETSATVTAKDHRVTLRYHIPEQPLPAMYWSLTFSATVW
jgi:hypothetical protein